ncbi:MAG: cation-translocating P-type ATPase [Desulfobacteraceae bacterium]|nr:cation-translocating P-type ATPase [Desulfobacteraceae bacterium]
MKQYRVVHRLSWRTRIKIPDLKQKAFIADTIAADLGRQPGVTGVAVRVKSLSVIIEHKKNGLSTDRVFSVLDRYFNNLPGTGSKREMTLKPASSPPRKHVSGTTLALSGAYMVFTWIAPLAALSSPILMAVPAIVALGLSIPIVANGIRSFRESGKPGTDLMTTAALFYSIATGNAGTALGVFWLFNLSSWLEERTVNHTRNTIRTMLRNDIKDVWLVKDGVEVQVPLSRIRPGDLISVRFGCTVPADGVVTKNKALVCEVAMTGESMPVLKEKGARVMAGTTMEAGHIIMRVEAVGETTRLAGIIRMVENAEESRAPVQRSAERFGRLMFPVSLGLFFGTLTVTGSVMRAMAMLIITCPCAMRISSSTALTAAMGNAAGRGILIKGGDALETAGKIDVLVFDKTGTLTQGSPTVSRVITLDDHFEPLDILKLSGSAQSPWKHPLTTAVMDKIKETREEIPKAEASDLIVGQGVRATISGKEVLVGSEKFMENRGIGCGDAAPLLERMLSNSETVVFVAKNKKLLGLIGVKDCLKENAASTLNALRAMGIGHMVMLTGDRKEMAVKAGRDLPLDEIMWSQSPEDKAEWIKKRKADYPGQVVAMVGDGINDTPAFAHADLSFAMGGTSADVAMAHGDIVLQKPDLALVAESVRLGKQCLSEIHENFRLTAGFNLACGVLTGMEWLSPFAGALAHNLITLGVVGKSGRLAFYDTGSDDHAIGAREKRNPGRTMLPSPGCNRDSAPKGNQIAEQCLGDA